MDSLTSASGREFRRAVVTGGAGFLGAHLCAALLRDGAEVVCVDDFSTGSPEAVAPFRDEPGFELAVADVSDGLVVDGAVDLVLHFASAASPPQYAARPVATLRVGSAGTYNALRLAERCGARFVMASTSEVYGDPLLHPQREDYWGNVNPVGPRSVYDEAKRFSEALTTAFGQTGAVDTGIVRIFNTYGPGMRHDDGRAVPNFVRQALAGEPLTVAGNGRQTRSLCFVDDLVRGVLALARSGLRTPVNIGNPHEVTVLELAERIRSLAGSGSPVRFVDAAPDDPRRRCPDITAAQRELGWSPETGLDEGLRRTIGWFASDEAAQRTSGEIRV
ncbi:NAD-dependent epimerase/dehydratase family protein [Actinosynnema sp. NPDC050436]|uniref:NAD-dependent epimerase/dehydratase family protein n=1 Tax=Actinosynnema sp. NPDC050436 TaxID=3155659 RepID=UPI0033FE8703